ncbi:hypothetical protein [Spirosoma pollinicola]|uniref:hypothetical protein n=1 Tax=Spirosoma pollinicola TaxID=2057025 RepID=UPI00147270C7|nr:hypothetical protein [Spirosoma pollinicola]
MLSAPRGIAYRRQGTRPRGGSAAQHDECVKVQVARVELRYVLTINTHGRWVARPKWASKAGYLRQWSRPDRSFWIHLPASGRQVERSG